MTYSEANKILDQVNKGCVTEEDAFERIANANNYSVEDAIAELGLESPHALVGYLYVDESMGDLGVEVWQGAIDLPITLECTDNVL